MGAGSHHLSPPDLSRPDVGTPSGVHTAFLATLFAVAAWLYGRFGPLHAGGFAAAALLFIVWAGRGNRGAGGATEIAGEAHQAEAPVGVPLCLNPYGGVAGRGGAARGGPTLGCSVVVRLPLMAHGQHGDDVTGLDLEQRHVARGTEGDDELAQIGAV